jgi:hypothetical protein
VQSGATPTLQTGERWEGDVFTKNPFDDVYAVEGEDPFRDLNELPPTVEQFEPPLAQPYTEQPYHVFSNGQKWLVIVIIGGAGLFSGLSSNIYFPSLDAIATASFD